MPTPLVSDDPLVQRHYLTQTALSAALAAELRRLWAQVDVTDLAGTLPRYKAQVASLVRVYGQASVEAAAQHFEEMRAKAGITSRFDIPIVDPAPMEQKRATLNWATEDLWSDPGGVGTSTDTIEKTQTKVEGAAQKLVLDAGRNELIAAIEQDKEAKGWARVTKPGACYFCRLLATRGAIYHTAGTAGRDANERFVGDGEAKFHDNCHCTIEPLFGFHYERTAQARADWALYKKHAQGHGDALNRFRKAVEAEATP